jgi:hypothetical protein
MPRNSAQSLMIPFGRAHETDRSLACCRLACPSLEARELSHRLTPHHTHFHDRSLPRHSSRNPPRCIASQPASFNWRILTRTQIFAYRLYAPPAHPFTALPTPRHSSTTSRSRFTTTAAPILVMQGRANGHACFERKSGSSLKSVGERSAIAPRGDHGAQPGSWLPSLARRLRCPPPALTPAALRGLPLVGDGRTGPPAGAPGTG